MRVDWGEWGGFWLQSASVEYYLRFVGGRLMEYSDLDMGWEFEVVSSQRHHIEWSLGKYRELRLAAGLSLIPVVVEACMTKRNGHTLYEIGVEW